MLARALRRASPLLVAAALTVGCTSAPPVVAPDRPPGVSPSSPAPVPEPISEIVVGTDELNRGFNPHTVADLTPTGTAVADLVFPSAFHQAPEGGWRLNTALLASAVVTDREPFTVTYRIRDDAAWSNATPISAQDFLYLVEQMTSQPGVVNPAGYELVDDVLSEDSGKTVRVVFSQPYPAWRSLFRHLLPAHLLKDAPGGWTDGLDNAIPASGGAFTLAALDPVRREIVLERNDRYWARPAQLDRLVLRQLPPAELVRALRTGGVAAAWFTEPDADVRTRLDRANAPEPTVLPRPVLTRLALRPAGGELAERDVRLAVAAALDRDSLLRVAGAADSPVYQLANAQVLAPSQPDYEPTLPSDSVLAGDTSGPAALLLRTAGYEQTSQGWLRDGEPLSLEIAAADGRAPAAQIASRVAIQLRAIGVAASVRTMPADELVAELAADDRPPALDAASTPALPTVTKPTVTKPTVTNPTVTNPSAGQTPTAEPDTAQPGDDDAGGDVDAGIDVAVLPQPVAADPATTLASTHCRADSPSGSKAALVGFCSPTQRLAVQGALGGAVPDEQILDVFEPMLWRRGISIPLYQPGSLFVTGPDLTRVSTGPLLDGPLRGAGQWRLRGR